VNEGLTPFEMWKERVLLLAVSAALAGYAALWVLDEAVERDDSGPPVEDQTYVRSGSPVALPGRAEDVFASENSADSWNESVPRRYVQPRAAVAVKAPETVELPPPPASVPAPAMLLPLPGPAPEYCDGLPRWPAAPSTADGP